MSLLALWLPVLLSAIAVFIISSVIHMALTYHRSNMSKLPNEDKFREATAALNIPPGDYTTPYAGSMKAMGTPEFQQKMDQGPVMMMTVMPNGPYAMGKSLLFWFIYSLLVGLFTAYVAIQAQTVLVDFASVMRLTATTAFMGYGLALIQDSIWWNRKWSTTFKFLFDALVYALLTGAMFAWLWPHVV